ncbi:MAG TPA: hypothetical protein PLE48_04020 [Thiobacillus sp.]|nr:MAG: hypothetical protein B7Y50_10190 [Hydrogenophilales bacterium 28-61-11]OYZ58694.1 MAG: hypothetical protein B7Y21_02120 [Hydrogenophilales bacterium 16-61-112]OZA45954.1 MAG: hypothetical protein B7X81_07600 [Hydrogenophilales bacterium 17-61-76]HQT30771.1 hypothetical protein [Thiobacillus sp.]HQT69575.1 hypothetical protein [Thiobacillus sp.]
MNKPQSLFDTHEQAFAVIDSDCRVVAANRRHFAGNHLWPHCHGRAAPRQSTLSRNRRAVPALALFKQVAAAEAPHTHFHADDQP